MSAGQKPSDDLKGKQNAELTPYFTRVGCDLVQISRLAEKLERSQERLANRLFLPSEVENAKGRVESLAGYYAAKEAFAKALGCGLMGSAGLSFLDLEVEKEASGRPKLCWNEKADELIRKQGELVSLDLSISHDGGMAMAVCVMLFVEAQENLA